jgi:hypothetical protein
VPVLRKSLTCGATNTSSCFPRLSVRLLINPASHAALFLKSSSLTRYDDDMRYQW